MTQRTMRILLSTALFCALVAAGRPCFAADERPVRAAVTPFAAPEHAPWLGMAVADAVAARLAGVAGVDVLERARIREVLLARGGDVTPGLLGVDALVTGTVMLDGPWAEPETHLRLTIRTVAAETGRIRGGKSFVLDGPAGSIFAMETEAARRLARRLGTSASRAETASAGVDALSSRELFGKALADLSEAEALLGPESLSGSTAPIDATDETRRRAGELLSRAETGFRAAGEAHRGVFHARAHQYEGTVRELTARIQPDADAAAKVREETLDRFRADAAAAAPALFDLGRALQAAEDYAAAIGAYADFVRWMDDASRLVRWEIKSPGACWCVMPHCFGTTLPSLSVFEYFAATPSCILVDTGRDLVVYDRETKKILHRTKLKGKNAWNRPHTTFVNADDASTVCVHGATVNAVETRTGRVRFRKTFAELETTDDLVSARHWTMAAPPGPETGGMLVVSRLWRHTDAEAGFLARILALDPETGETAWTAAVDGIPTRGGYVLSLPQAWRGLLFQPAAEGVAVFDARTGADATDRVSEALLGLLAAAPTKTLLCPASDADGVYITTLFGRDGVRVLHAPTPDADPTDTGVRRFMFPLLRTHFAGAVTHLSQPVEGLPDPDAPVLAFDGATGRFRIVTERLPRADGNGPLESPSLDAPVTPRRVHDGGELVPVLERGGFLWNNRLCCRTRSNGFLVYELRRGEAPELLYRYQHPWRVFSWPAFDGERLILFVTATGLGGCYLLEVEAAGGVHTLFTESAALERMATCHVELGEIERAVERLRLAVEHRYDAPGPRRKLARLCERLGRLGEASAEYEALMTLEHPDSDEWRAAEEGHGRTLGRVMAVPVSDTPPVVAGTRCVATAGPDVICVDLETEREVWRRPRRGDPGGLALRGRRVCVSGPCPDTGRLLLVSYDVVTGERGGTASLPTHLMPSHACPEGPWPDIDAPWTDAAPVIFVPRSRGDAVTVGVDAATCETLWSFEFSPVFRATDVSVLQMKGRVVLAQYALDGSGVEVACLDSRSGDPLWTRVLSFSEKGRIIRPDVRNPLLLRPMGDRVAVAGKALSMKDGAPVERTVESPYTLWSLVDRYEDMYDPAATLAGGPWPNTRFHVKPIPVGDGLLLGSSFDGPLAVIIDPVAKTALRKTVVGLDDSMVGHVDRFLHRRGDWIIGECEPARGHMIFRLRGFLDAVGWTENVRNAWLKTRNAAADAEDAP